MNFSNPNSLIADRLSEMAALHSKDKNRKRSYTRAANAIRNFHIPIPNGDYAKKNIAGIGPSIAAKIDEILKHGNTQTLLSLSPEEKLRENTLELFQTIHGVGRSNAEQWYNANYRTLADLMQLYNSGSMDNAQKLGYQYYNDLHSPIPRIELMITERIFKTMFYPSSDHSQGIKNKLEFEFAGSYRRGELSSGDLDVLFKNRRADGSLVEIHHIVNKLTEAGLIIGHLTNNCTTKYMGIFRIQENSYENQGSPKARRIDIRLIEPESWAAALLYFTGSKQFNILIRQRALDLGYSLSEYSMTPTTDQTKLQPLPKFTSESDIFSFLGVKYIKPVDRSRNLQTLELVTEAASSQIVPSQIDIYENAEKSVIFLVDKRIFSLPPNSKVAAFDLDGTLIENRNGHVFSNDLDQMMISANRLNILQQCMNSGYTILIFSNQRSKTQNKRIQITNKLFRAMQLLDIPCILFAALEADENRKPATGMWNLAKTVLPHIELEGSFYCGDAAGRAEDFSDSDLLWAKNLNIPFYTPEEMFTNS